MSAGALVTAIILFIIAAALLVLSISHFLERGFLLNNAYLYASKKDRENMNKKPHYRQSAIVFFLLSAVFFIIGLSVVIRNDKVLLIEIPVMIAAIIYAIVSSVKMNKQSEK